MLLKLLLSAKLQNGTFSVHSTFGGWGSKKTEFGLSNSPFSFDDFYIKRGFLGQEAICGHGCHEICGKPSDAPVARVFNLNDVFQFVVYRLYQRPFPQ